MRERPEPQRRTPSSFSCTPRTGSRVPAAPPAGGHGRGRWRRGSARRSRTARPRRARSTADRAPRSVPSRRAAPCRGRGRARGALGHVAPRRPGAVIGRGAAAAVGRDADPPVALECPCAGAPSMMPRPAVTASGAAGLLVQPGPGGGDEASAAHQGERQQLLDRDACDVRDHDTMVPQLSRRRNLNAVLSRCLRARGARDERGHQPERAADHQRGPAAGDAGEVRDQHDRRGDGERDQQLHQPGSDASLARRQATDRCVPDRERQLPSLSSTVDQRRHPGQGHRLVRMLTLQRAPDGMQPH